MELDIGLFWRYRIMLLICTLAGVACAVGYVAFGTISYQVMARVLVQPQVAAANAELTRRVDPEFLPTQAETIRSPALIAEVLKSVPVTPPPGADLERFDPVRHVLSSLTVTPVLKANVLTIAYRSCDQAEAIELIEGLVKAHSKRIAESDIQNATGSLQITELAEASLRIERDRLNAKYDDLRRQSPMLGKGREADAQLLTHLRTLGDELSSLKKERIAIEAKLSAVDGVMLEQPRGAASSGNLASAGAGLTQVNAIVNAFSKLITEDEAIALSELTERLTNTQFSLNKLAVIYGDRHPQMIAIRSELETCERLIRQRAESFRNGWSQQVSLLKQSEENVASEFAIEERQVKASETFLVQEQHLLGEVEKLERLHETAMQEVLAQRAQQERVSNGLHSIQVTIIDGPAIIDEMTWPKPKLLMATCAALGLCIGCSLVLLVNVIRTESSSGKQTHSGRKPKQVRPMVYAVSRGNQQLELEETPDWDDFSPVSSPELAKSN